MLDSKHTISTTRLTPNHLAPPPPPRYASPMSTHTHTPPAPLNFASDNVAGAAPRVIEAVVAANAGFAAAYGGDDVTARVEVMFCALFEREVAVVLLPTGTAANALAVACFTPPWGAVLTHEESHLADDECGAPEFFSHGAKIIGLPGLGCKLDPATIIAQLARMPHGAMKQVQPMLLSVSNVTESGLVYSPAEIRALKDAVTPRGLALHMDGARFANAVAALGCSPAEITWKAGVDVLSFGGTKIGAMAAEAIIFFDPAKARDVKFMHKRSGHVLSKTRFLSAQFEALLADGYWLELARHANAMATRLASGIADIPGCRNAWETQANEVFVIARRSDIAHWRSQGLMTHEWSSRSLRVADRPTEGEDMIRLVTSFATSFESVDRLLHVMNSARG